MVACASPRFTEDYAAFGSASCTYPYSYPADEEDLTAILS
jgi:hypothetical protein